MIIKFILAIDNSKPLSEAKETISIAKEIRKEWKEKGRLNDCPIVGVDFAPKPLEDKHLNMFESVLREAREDVGLKVTIHYAEYMNRKHSDDVLRFRPDRLGHAVNLVQFSLSLSSFLSFCTFVFVTKSGNFPLLRLVFCWFCSNEAVSGILLLV